MIYDEEGCCLEQWCLYVHRLKSASLECRLAGPDHETETGPDRTDL